ncbi:hypothetical protein E2320_003012, partial [Naja naja]
MMKRNHILHNDSDYLLYITFQLAYGTFSPVNGDKTVFPFVNQMVPDEIYQYIGIIQLFQHFQWNWIGVLTADDDYGDKFLQKIGPLLSQNNICYAFILRTPQKAYVDEYINLISVELRYDQLFMDDKVKVLLLSLCNDHCSGGSSKKKKEGEKFCCYDCVLCPEGEISDKI